MINLYEKRKERFNYYQIKEEFRDLEHYQSILKLSWLLQISILSETDALNLDFFSPNIDRNYHESLKNEYFKYSIYRNIFK